MRRVVITGLGVVSPLGVGVQPVWEKLIRGVSGVRRIDAFDCSDLPSKIAGTVPTVDNVPEGFAASDCFDISKFIDVREERRMGRFIIYAVASAQMAFDDLGWLPGTYEEQCRTGIIYGSGIGGLDKIDATSVEMQARGTKRVSPFFIPSSLINLASGNISIRHNLKGPNYAVVTACASGTHAIGDAYNLIRNDYADVMVTGAAEAAICKIGIAGFAAAKALSTSYNETPEQASRPWDDGRDGFVMAEGAATLILEEYEHAKRRGAKIYAEVVGFGMSGDAYHITSPSPDGDGAYRSMLCALKSSGISADKINYINAHGTSTQPGDLVELNAASRLFAGNKIFMSSTKSSIGHALGAAGAIEALFCVKAIGDSVVPATLNLHKQCVESFIDLVPLKIKESKLDYVMSNSFGFGGTNATVIFKRFE